LARCTIPQKIKRHTVSKNLYKLFYSEKHYYFYIKTIHHEEN